MKNTFAKIVAFSTFLLHGTANPIMRQYYPQTKRLASDAVFNHDGYVPIAASRLSHTEVRGSDGTAGQGREYGLRDSESFYWGAAGIPRANMTAVANDNNVKILSLERFSDAVTATVCSGSTIKLTLDEETKFDGLQASWAWVNDADDNYIAFVTDECPDFDYDGVGMQAWHVTAAAFDDASNAATLSATPVPWQDAFPRWHLHISSRSLLPDEQAGLATRDFSQGSISLTQDYSSEPYALGSEEGAPTIACSPCGTFGELDYDFDIDFDGTTSVTLTPSGVGAEVTALLAIEGALSAEASLTHNLLNRNIEGIKIGSWVSIGPTVYVDLKATIGSATAKAELSAGLKMTIPDDSVAFLSMDSGDSNNLEGWGPVFESTLTDPEFETAVSVSASAGLQIRIEFDALIHDKGLAAGLVIDAPTLTFNAEAKIAKGACDNVDAAAGVDVSLDFGGSLSAFAGPGRSEDLPNEFEITSIGTPIYTTCMAVTDAPPASSSSAVPTITSSAPSWVISLGVRSKRAWRKLVS